MWPSACCGCEEGIDAILEVCLLLFLAEGFLGPSPWERVAMSAMQREHGQVGTWNVFIGCGHMHDQHATNESTPVQDILRKNGSFVGQGGEAGGVRVGHKVAWFGVMVP
jgi:diadenosine tetraphosphatase ApaH/serine/threonine PP2A family protein phosphatase